MGFLSLPELLPLIPQSGDDPEITTVLPGKTHFRKLSLIMHPDDSCLKGFKVSDVQRGAAMEEDGTFKDASEIHTTFVKVIEKAYDWYSKVPGLAL